MFVLLGALFVFQTTDNTLEEKYKVSFVTLDVVAVSKSGRLVTDLELSDFVIKEGRKKITPTYFEVLDFRQGEPFNREEVAKLAATSGPILNPVQQFIIAIDLQATKFIDFKNTFRQLRQFVQSLDEAINYKINIFALEYGSMTGGFATTKTEVVSAVNQLEEKTFNSLKRKFSPDEQDLLIRDRDEGGNRNQGDLFRTGTLTNDVANLADLEKALRMCGNLGLRQRPGQNEQCVNSTVDDFMDRQRLNTQRIIFHLEQLAYQFLDDLSGIKVMLLISPGFGMENHTAIQQMVERFKPTSGPLPDRLPGSTYNMDPDKQFRKILHACVRNRVIFHTFDIFNTSDSWERSFGAAFTSKAGMSGIYRTYGLEVTQSLLELAKESGGTFTQSLDFQNDLKRALDTNQFFYVIGYQSPPGKAGEFRKIRVKTKRKGVHLRHRRGYFSGGP